MSTAWSGILGNRSSPRNLLEGLAETGIKAVSLSAIASVFLLFLFVGRETLPIFIGNRGGTTAPADALKPAQIVSMEPHRLRGYLGLSEEEFARLDIEALRLLLDLRAQAAGRADSDPDSRMDTLSPKHLLLPHAWADYDQPAFVWQPVSHIPKFNLVPLLMGTLKVTLVALLVGVPPALAAALYVSQFAPRRLRRWLKPAVELLAAVPSVILGAVAVLLLATPLQNLLGYPYRLNAFVAGITLGFSSIPVVFSIAEEALGQVPRSLSRGADALGASRWQTALWVVVPGAAPGLVAAVILGFGRCIGETMIVLVASGNAALVSPSLFDPARTLTATIAAELGETVVGGPHYRMLFLLGSLLLLVTFASSTAAQYVLSRLHRNVEDHP